MWFCIFNIQQFEKTNFLNLVKGYKKKIKQQKDMVMVVTRSQEVEYTPSNLHEKAIFETQLK